MAYDLVLFLFGIFFLPDMDGSARKLASMLRPGGQRVITTWERGCLEPVVATAALASGRSVIWP